MALEKFILQVRGFLTDVEKVFPDKVAEAAISSNSLIVNRIQETGIGSNGSQLGEYTDGAYKDFRAATGRTTRFVNLSNTNAMFNSIKLISTKTIDGVTTSTIGTNIQEEDDKLFYNAVRYNDEILALTQEEESLITEILDDELQILIDKNFK